MIRYAEAHGMTMDEVQQCAGIGDELMKTLWDGYYTTPHIALEIGEKLGLTSEEVHELGPLDRFNPVQAIEVNSNYQKHRRTRANCMPRWWELLHDGKVHWEEVLPWKQIIEKWKGHEK